MQVVENQLGRDAILLDVSVNAIGPHTPDGGWHVDSPITQMPEPLPNFTLSLQTVWMLDDFRRENGATHVARGSHLTLRKPPAAAASSTTRWSRGPAGSLAIWFSQTWHRHGANTTDARRRGIIVQYGRCWVKPFVDLRTPMTAEQAAGLAAPAIPDGLQRQRPSSGLRVDRGTNPDRGPRQSDALLASYVGFTFLAWYLNGLGAVLPPLHDEVGDWAGVYALLPGAVLFAWGGLVTVMRPRAVQRLVANPASPSVSGCSRCRSS